MEAAGSWNSPSTAALREQHRTKKRLDMAAEAWARELMREHATEMAR